jgi:TrmH family RNA methyltransferase
MNLISSHSNPKIKLARQLRQRKYRQETGLALVEGIHHVGQAVEAATAPEARLAIITIFYAPDLLTSEYAAELIEQQSRLGVPCLATSQAVFESIADKENPQGIMAVVRPQQPTLAQLTATNFTWGVALVSAQDPGNIGTILRTIDAVSASGLLLLDACADPYHPGSVRASMGAIFWYPVVQATFAEFADWSEQNGYHLYGTSAHGSTDYRQISRYPRPTILLMGSEREGLSEEHIARCQDVVRLPMRGRVSSLNLAVAAGVLLYEMMAR